MQPHEMMIAGAVGMIYPRIGFATILCLAWIKLIGEFMVLYIKAQGLQ